MAAASATRSPEWTFHDPEARPGTLDRSRCAARRFAASSGSASTCRRGSAEVRRYPLLIVHDGDDYLNYASAKTVLDNLIHRSEVAPLVVARSSAGRDRLVEYANYAPHARFVARELVPFLTEELPLIDLPDGRCLMGSSFGGVASLSTAVRYPSVFGSLLLESGSFVFTDIGAEHGGGRSSTRW